MFSKSLTLTTLALASGLAHADFRVYCGRNLNGLDGGVSTDCFFFANPPSCDDINNGYAFTVNNGNDVSNVGGIACDGCDAAAAPKDWTITRLEVNDDFNYVYWKGGPEHVHFTIRTGDTGIGIIDVDGTTSYGSCTIGDGNAPDCSNAAGNIGLKNNFNCVSPLYFEG